MTQDDLAERVGVDRTAVSNWERGRHFPQRYLGRVEAVLGISLDDDAPSGYRPVSDELRRLIAEELPGDTEAQRRVIGLLEGTLTWPASNPGQPQANGGQAEEHRAR